MRWWDVLWLLNQGIDRNEIFPLFDSFSEGEVHIGSLDSHNHVVYIGAGESRW